MDKTIKPGNRYGEVIVPASKSVAHRMLILAAMSEEETEIICDGASEDVIATADCLNALGAKIVIEGAAIKVRPLRYRQVLDDIEENPVTDGKLNDGMSAVNYQQKENHNICRMMCRESGSTLRFMLPLGGVLGKDCIYYMEGRLPERPLGPFADELILHGMKITRADENKKPDAEDFSEKNCGHNDSATGEENKFSDHRIITGKLLCTGKLAPGEYSLPGNISSQYISGMLMALPFSGDSSTTAPPAMSGVEACGNIREATPACSKSGAEENAASVSKKSSHIKIVGNIESGDYIKITESVLGNAGIKIVKTDDGYIIPGGQTGKMAGRYEVERDWSGATFFLCIGALSEEGVTVKGMDLSSAQGDKKVLDVLADFGADIEVNIKRTEADTEKFFGNDGSTIADITVKKGQLKGIVIDARDIPDAVPALAVVAAAACGTTKIINAQRLRMKETDRIRTVYDMLKALGADVKETEDGLEITGSRLNAGTTENNPEKKIYVSGSLHGGTVDSAMDHRIAMAAAVAACICEEPVTVKGSECVRKSYPDFWKDYEALFIAGGKNRAVTDSTPK